MTEAATMDLFGNIEPSFDDESWTVRPVNPTTAERWIARYHYLGRPAGGGARAFGIYAGDLIAVVMTANPTNVHGVAKRYDLTRWRGNVEIARVAVHPDAPKNTTSRAVASVCDVLAGEGVEWVFSYADTGQGHHGGIYQALNAVYVGMSPGRAGYLLDGEPVHPRTIVATFGTQAWPHVRDLAAAQGRTLERVDDLITPKHTYILIIARDRRTRYAIRQALKPYAKPYPKRAGGRVGRTPANQPGTEGSTPSPRSDAEVRP